MHVLEEYFQYKNVLQIEESPLLKYNILTTV